MPAADKSALPTIRPSLGNGRFISYIVVAPTDCSLAISLDFNGPGIPQTPGLPPKNTSCPSGLRMQVLFPSCWDGINVDSPNHMDHMAYPDMVDSGNCPATHPKRLVTIFYEVWLNTGAFTGMEGQIVLSNGDATGFGLHGDFFNGWNRDVLRRAIQTCTAGSGMMEDCPVFMNEGRFNPDDVANACNAPHPIPSEMHTTSDILTHLPGCAMVTYGPDPAPAADDLVPGCDPNVPFVNSGNNMSSNAPPPSSVAHSSSSAMGNMPAPSSSWMSSMPSHSAPPMGAAPKSSSKPASSSPPPMPMMSSSSSPPMPMMSNSPMASNGDGGSPQPVWSTPKPQPSMGTGMTSIKPSSAPPMVMDESKPSSLSNPHSSSSSEKPEASHHHHH